MEMRRSSIRPSGARRLALGETALSIGAVLVLLTVLVSMDGRVRDVIALRGGAGHPVNAVAEAGGRARDLTMVVLEAARDQSIEHAPLVIFTLAATVLVVFMLRT